ncbi:SDR family oxidoreductase [Actinacidiphila yeochonensis]|uniref:SDR family oxidoreductase n=1 Tax=Actinacidiphila yeochonensis TaxID=89050 RepID=UPI00056AFD6F|nr:SDR family oxidoreductase [Actinacidiphila yeochonensis]
MSRPTALITGGTSGIGRATAELLHERGHRVMVTGLAGVDQARKTLPAEITVVRADSRSLADIDHAMDEARERFGTLDMLFLNAGMSQVKPLAATDEADFDALFDTNVKGGFFTLQKALPLLNDGASVIFTVGAGVDVPAPAMLAVKGALLPLMRAAAKELAPRRIRVNAVSPGVIDTPAYSRRGISRETLESWSAAIPLGRVGLPAEIAEAVAFLASDAARYITGDNLVVSGGMGVSAW